MAKDKLTVPKGTKFDLRTGQFAPHTPSDTAPSYKLDKPLDMTYPDGSPLTDIEFRSFGKLETRRGSSRLHFDETGLALSENEKGVLISAPTVVRGGEIEFKTTEIDAQELRISSLFWDKLVFPLDPLMPLPTTPDIKFLMDEGILVRPRATAIGGWSPGEATKRTYTELLARLRNTQGDGWSMARGENSITILDEENETTEGVYYDLQNVIPVPTQEVPLDDILQFKNRHHAELLALRTHLDDLCELIASDPDTELAKTREMARLVEAIENHLKLSRESSLPMRLIGIRPKFSIEKKVGLGTVTAGITVAGWAKAVGMPDNLSMLAGVGGSLLSAGRVSATWPQAPDKNLPYEYVASYQKDVFWRR